MPLRLRLIVIASPQCGFIASLVWEILGKTKSHNFQRLPLSSILYNDFLNFLENRDKEFKLGPMHSNFARTGNYITSST